MRYSGSKGGVGEISRVIQSLLPPDGCYFEPFCGACKVMQYVRCKERYGVDISRPIINLLNAVQAGWQPPKKSTEERWHQERADWEKGLGSPMTGFYGYGCSYGGMFFHSYITPESNRGLDPAKETRSSLLKQAPMLRGAHLHCGDYQHTQFVRPWSVVYCDPPYHGTYAVGSDKEKFDSMEFWSWAIDLSKTSIVLVSEYDCPYTRAEVVWSKEAQTRQGNNHKRKTKNKVEKLFLLRPTKVGFGIKF